MGRGPLRARANKSIVAARADDREYALALVVRFGDKPSERRSFVATHYQSASGEDGLSRRFPVGRPLCCEHLQRGPQKRPGRVGMSLLDGEAGQRHPALGYREGRLEVRPYRPRLLVVPPGGREVAFRLSELPEIELRVGDEVARPPLPQDGQGVPVTGLGPPEVPLRLEHQGQPHVGEGRLGRVADLAPKGQGLLAHLPGAEKVAQLEEKARRDLEIAGHPGLVALLAVDAIAFLQVPPGGGQVPCSQSTIPRLCRETATPDRYPIWRRIASDSSHVDLAFSRSP